MARSTKGSDTVVVEGIIQWVSDKGVKVYFDQEGSVAITDWLPLSQIRKSSIANITPEVVGASCVFYIPRWLAETKADLEYLEKAEYEEAAENTEELLEELEGAMEEFED